MRFLGYILLGIHCLLFFWSVGGYLEMILPKVFWKPFTNPEFPNWLLFIHWGSVLVASIGFIYGYLSRWPNTPQFMAYAYGFMALVCVVETFGYMTGKSKYGAMGAEYFTYAIILFLFFRTSYFNTYFDGPMQ